MGEPWSFQACGLIAWLVALYFLHIPYNLMFVSPITATCTPLVHVHRRLCWCSQNYLHVLLAEYRKTLSYSLMIGKNRNWLSRLCWLHQRIQQRRRNPHRLIITLITRSIPEAAKLKTRSPSLSLLWLKPISFLWRQLACQRGLRKSISGFCSVSPLEALYWAL